MLPSQYVEQGWCQHSFAKNSYGTSVDYYDVAAEQWCLDGALKASLFTNGINSYQYDYMCKKLQNVLSVKNIATWNDVPNREKHDVVKILQNLEHNLPVKEKELVLV